MDLGVIIALCVVVFGGGIWFQKITSKLDKVDKSIIPLVILHKKELLEYYLANGVMPNPGMTERKRYLINRLESGTLSFAESQELSRMLKAEEQEARRVNNTNALIAILGLLALLAVVAALSKK